MKSSSYYYNLARGLAECGHWEASDRMRAKARKAASIKKKRKGRS